MPGPLVELAAHAQKVLRPGSIFDLKRDFLCTTPISPPHGDTQQWALKAKSGIPLEGSTFDGMNKAKAESLAPLGKMKAQSDTYRSAFIKFRPVINNLDGQEGALTFDIKYADELKDDASRSGWLACWFLPWKSGHLLKMRIPKHDARLAAPAGGGLPPENADIFFTAAINGCSVFVYGATDNPTVVHAGISFNFPDVLSKEVLNALGGEGASVWRNLLNGATVASDGQVTANPQKTRTNFTEVNRFDYISQMKGGKIIQTTQESENVEAYLNKHRKDSLQIASLNPWGSVSGVRANGGEWMFILQRNVSVRYQSVFRTKGGLLTKSKITYGQVTTTSVNVGHNIFFPKPGVAHVRELASLTVV